jgi:hypothetical protein
MVAAKWWERNMKTLKNSLILCGLLLAASMSFGQTILKMTTLSSAVANSSTTSISLASTSGLTAGGRIIFVADGAGEAMFVNSVPTSGPIGVTRGYATLGKARAHASGALVFLVPTAALVGYPPALNTVQPTGSCTRTSTPYLPVISAGLAGTAAVISDCLGGVWVNGAITAQGQNPTVMLNVSPGNVLYTSINTNGTTLTANDIYCTELDIPFNKYATGLAMLNGTSVATDHHQYLLYDATGNLIANTASTTSFGSASEYGPVAFTTPYYMVGPAKYFGCMWSNGTTATIRMLLTQVNDFLPTTAITTATYGTIPTTITVPTTFTTAVGPYQYVY